MCAREKVLSFTSQVNYYLGLKEVNYILQQENTQLKNQVEELYSQLKQLDSTSFKSLEGEPLPQYSYLPAKVIANSTNKLQNYLIIDRGRKDGVQKDMGVITSQGVVGIITNVSDNYSYVVSFLNTSHSISAKINPSGAFGPLVWEGRKSNYATLTEIPHHIKFKVGDTVCTSGYSTIFPPDIPIGTARKSTLKSGTHHRIQVKLFQDFHMLHYVKVVVNNNRVEIDSLSKRTFK